MKKKVFYVIIFISSIFIFNINLSAASTATTTTSVYVRSGAGTNYSKIALLSKGKSLSMVSTSKYSGTGCSGGWYKVTYNGVTRYMCSNYLTVKTTTTATAAKVVGTATGKTTTSVYVRSGAGTGYSKVALLSTGKSVSLVGTTKYSGAGCSGGWYKIAYNGVARYMCSSYVKVTSTPKPTTTTTTTTNTNTQTNSATPKVEDKKADVVTPTVTPTAETKSPTETPVTPTTTTVSTTTAKTTTALNVRSSSTTSSTLIATLASGTSVSLVSTSKYSGAGCAGGWYKINYKNVNRYVCSSYVKVTTTTTTIKTNAQLDGYINASSVNVRSGAGTGNSLVGAYEFGTQLKLLNTSKYSGTGCGDGWYKVQFTVNGSTKTGYICSSYVYKYADIKATDAAYATTLRNAGFPESYIPYLTKLHKQHPNWNFVAEKNNLDFNTAVTKESAGSTSLLQTNFSSYRASSKVYDGSNWYAANSKVVAVYLDPRNFLTERHIFMFENLNYDSGNSNETVLKTMFGTSYLKNYISSFLTSAQNNSISARHVAARAISETGLNGSDATKGITFTYNNKQYKVYNFCNIGAYAGTNALMNGLYYAAGLQGNTAYGVPWTTPEKSINGCAQFLATGYINQGQNTPYYQKFNVSVNRKADAYTHQYMQNIKAPMSEAADTYNGLVNSKIQNSAYTFRIPVFNNMPTYTVLP